MLIAGAGIGVLGLASAASSWIDEDPNSPVWLTSRFDAFGPGLMGAIFYFGSFVSLRNRTRAARVFTLGTPIVGFVLAYPSAGYLVWEKEGGIFKLPLLSTAATLACVFYVPVVFLWLALHTRGRSRIALVASTLFAIVVFVASPWSAALLPRLAGWSAFPMTFAAFWYWTGKRDWPPLAPPIPRSVARKIGAVMIGGVAFVLLVLGGTLALTIFRSTTNWSMLCKGPGFFTKPVGANHIALTARLIRVGHVRRVRGKWAGDWAIGVVQERFWGLPSWAHLVLLTDAIFWDGQTFFISGERPRGILTRFLPIVDARPCTGVAARTADSEVHLRVLRHPLAASETRLTGVVRVPKRDANLLNAASAGARSDLLL